MNVYLAFPLSTPRIHEYRNWPRPRRWMVNPVQYTVTVTTSPIPVQIQKQRAGHMHTFNPRATLQPY
jgi:hypothetical protein